MEKKMENEMETRGILSRVLWVIWGLYRDYMGIMEKKMETTG